MSDPQGEVAAPVLAPQQMDLMTAIHEVIKSVIYLKYYHLLCFFSSVRNHKQKTVTDSTLLFLA